MAKAPVNSYSLIR